MSAIRTLPAAIYRGEETLRREREVLLNPAWRLIGHDNMAPNRGDYLADLTGGSVVVVRDNAGALQGFHNVCRHRAGPLVAEATGNCGGELTCRYHGWRYALDGRLRSAADFGVAEGFDPRAFGLHRVRVETWRGFVFVCRDASTPPLMELLAPLDAIWRERGFAQQPFAGRRRHELACNWKTYVENYLEGYHVPHIHPALSAEIDASAYRVEMRGSVALHHAPRKGGGDAGVYDGLWAWVWPDLGVNVYCHGMMIERITPLSASRTALDYIYFYDPARLNDRRAAIEMSDFVTAEDKAICEQVQANLDAGIYDWGVLSPKHENAVAWFQAQVARAHS
jgi:choline monooxygenase